VALLTLGAVSATFAEALSGDTAKAATAAAGASAHAPRGLAALLPSPCVNCPDGATPHTGALDREAAVASAGAVAGDGGGGAAASTWFMVVWCMGVCILTAVLIIQTCLANYQNWAAETFGRAPNEAMFYMHAFSLPLFLFTLPNMLSHAATWSASPSTGDVVAGLVRAASAASPSPWGVGGPSALWAHSMYWATLPVSGLPVMWTYILVNVVSQYLCIKGVYNLTPIADPLTVNVTLTVRKFLSLLVSIVMFNNTFTAAHWLGAALVFAGAAAYGQMPSPPKLPAAAGEAAAAASVRGAATSAATVAAAEGCGGADGGARSPPSSSAGGPASNADSEAAGGGGGGGTSSAVSASGAGGRGMHHRPSRGSPIGIRHL